ncbi:MAG: hypothetical protein BWX83_01171 [Candidatus Cloacimonetes bacterium ADurb.Bin117]|nr:MAG: hypothetical protein BWX83_01171 [Candidatus Cloacimonetes bacterium ADurb.Bin117]
MAAGDDEVTQLVQGLFYLDRLDPDPRHVDFGELGFPEAEEAHQHLLLVFIEAVLGMLGLDQVVKLLRGQPGHDVPVRTLLAGEQKAEFIYQPYRQIKDVTNELEG